jgi:putative phosphoribosyl transferase
MKTDDVCGVRFASRESAGLELGHHLVERGIQPDLVVGLPRGGVVVAAEVARVLERPLGVLVVRKIGHPRHREFAAGALAEPDVVILDEPALAAGGQRTELNEIIIEERQRLSDYQSLFHRAGDRAISGRRILIIDDGLATGATAEAAVMSARKQKAAGVILAVPVASPDGAARLRAVADEVIALTIDYDFMAVGQYYDSFPQTTDDEVIHLLNCHA